jgi:hypothetical protein
MSDVSRLDALRAVVLDDAFFEARERGETQAPVLTEAEYKVGIDNLLRESLHAHEKYLACYGLPNDAVEFFRAGPDAAPPLNTEELAASKHANKLTQVAMLYDMWHHMMRVKLISVGSPVEGRAPAADGMDTLRYYHHVHTLFRAFAPVGPFMPLSEDDVEAIKKRNESRVASDALYDDSDMEL